MQTIHIFTPGNKTSIKSGSGTTSKTFISVKAETAQPIVNAFARAIKMCQAKK